MTLDTKTLDANASWHDKQFKKDDEPSSHSNEGSHPGFFNRALNYLSQWIFEKPKSSQDKMAAMNINYHYPKIANRYLSFGWNRNYQYCYTDEDIALINQLKQQYHDTISKDETKNPFGLNIEKRFYDWWTCATPKTQLPHHFTLANREAKGLADYPLWHYADNVAKLIANWQGERVKNQNKDLLNDPTMIAFDYLKNVFFNELTTVNCQKTDLETIASLQSFVKQLIHTVPKFGPDRLHLIDIQKRLNVASKIIENCITNKQLPDLLADITIKTRGLEDTLGHYLHFLLIDEEVAENFSFEFIDANKDNYRLSPISKAYFNVEKPINARDTALVPFKAVNKFYQLQPTNAHTQDRFKLQLRKDALNGIKFADFVTEKQKQNYLATLSNLESLIIIRKSLDEFKNTQERVGTYIFASSYLQNINKLAQNYLALIDQSYALSEGLIQSADQGLELLQQCSNTPSLTSFENNLRALDERFAKKTTTSRQLEDYCLRAKNSMEAYQAEINKLALSLQSGQGKQEINQEMQNLLMQINSVNALVSAQLTKNEMVLEPPSQLSLNDNQQNTICYEKEEINCKAEAEKIDDGDTTAIKSYLWPIFTSALHGAIHGVLRGSANLVQDLLTTKNWSEKSAYCLSQISYYSMLFGYHLLSSQLEDEEETLDFYSRITHAAYITGQTWLLNAAINWISNYSDKIANHLKQHDYHKLSKAIKGGNALTRFSIFAYDAKTSGVASTTAAITAGMTSQIAVETIGKKLIH